jgi:PAS domain S-box-containing protein
MPHRRPFYSLRARLILLVLLALLPVLAILVYNAAENRDREAARVRAEVAALSRLAASQQEQVIESARQVLISLAQLPEVRGGDSAACTARLAQLMEHYQQGYTGFAAARPNGDLFCRSVPLSEPINVANSASFQQARDTADLSIGQYQVGRGSGKPNLGVCYPVLGTANQVQAVICGGLDLNLLNQRAAQAPLPGGAVLVITDRNGTILVRHPDPEAWTGRSLPDEPLIQALLSQPVGQTEVRGVDGVTRLYAFTQISSSVDTGIHLAVGIPPELAFAEVNRRLARDLALMGLVALLTVALAWWGSAAFVLRQVRAVVGATQRLSRGDLSTRVELPGASNEIDQLGRDFNSMAAALQQREAERRQAEQALREQREWLQVTLASIGDAVIATDVAGNVTFLNPVARSLTGWEHAEALGRPLTDVFQIMNAQTREPVENPVVRVIREGTIVGLANHTHLIARDGKDIPIDDSGAPIRDDAGNLLGVVLIFRDVTERAQAEEALRLSRDQLAIILQGAADGIVALDRTGRLRYANDAATRLMGYPSVEALLNAPLSEIIQKFETYDEAGQPLPGERLPGRLVLQGAAHAAATIRYRDRATGEERWSLEKSTAVFDANGRVELAVNILHDITDLKHAELAQRLLAEAGRLLAASLDTSTRLANLARLAVPVLADWCAVDVVDVDDTIRRVAVAHVDPAKVAFAYDVQRRYPTAMDAPTGVPRVLRTGESEFYPHLTDAMLEAAARDADHLQLLRELNLRSAMIVPLIARGRTLGAFTLVWAESGRTYRPQDLALAEELGRRAGLAIDNARLYDETQQLNAELEQRIHERTAQLRASNTQLQNEIAERQQAQRRLEESQAQLRQLSGHLQAAREEERGRIAREVHDELGQMLTGLKMDLVSLQRSLKSQDSAVQQKFESMSQLISATIQSVRRIATELRPGVLDDLGLVAAIEWQLREFKSHMGIECELISRLDETTLDPEGKTALFRILQETLTNVARHANATSVIVNLEEGPDDVTLQVKDNGRGITQGEIVKSRSFGLLGMRERVHLLNGELMVHGVPGQGTTVLVRVPFQRRPITELE